MIIKLKYTIVESEGDPDETAKLSFNKMVEGVEQYLE